MANFWCSNCDSSMTWKSKKNINVLICLRLLPEIQHMKLSFTVSKCIEVCEGSHTSVTCGLHVPMVLAHAVVFDTISTSIRVSNFNQVRCFCATNQGTAQVDLIMFLHKKNPGCFSKHYVNHKHLFQNFVFNFSHLPAS